MGGVGMAGPQKYIVWMALDTSKKNTPETCLAQILAYGGMCEHDYFTFKPRGHHGGVGSCGCRRNDLYGKAPPMQVTDHASFDKGNSDYYKFVGDCPHPLNPCKTNNGGGCHPMRKCIWKPMANPTKQFRCGKCRKGTNDGARGCKGAGGSTSPTSPTDPCKTNNGGCDSKRKCTSKGGKVTCGNCPAGFTNNGAKGCTKSATDPCKTNNGGCDSKRKCTSKGGKVTCGNCPAGFTNND